MKFISYKLVLLTIPVFPLRETTFELRKKLKINLLHSEKITSVKVTKAFYLLFGCPTTNSKPIWGDNFTHSMLI